MTSTRAAVRMSDREVADFLLEGNRKLQVATVNADGSPHLATLFFVVQEGRIGFWTYGKSQKIRNLERDARVSCLVEDGEDYFELRGVSISGTAELVRDRAAIRELGTAVAMRMAGVDSPDALGDLGRGMVEKQAAKRVGVWVTPESVATWDHRKMLAGAAGGTEGRDGT